MVTDERSAFAPEAGDDVESGAGMAHLTVVPTNFDPDEGASE